MMNYLVKYLDDEGDTSNPKPDTRNPNPKPET